MITVHNLKRMPKLSIIQVQMSSTTILTKISLTYPNTILLKATHVDI